MSDTTDLWPIDLNPANSLKSPLSILRTQAAALGRKTKGLVEGKVETRIALWDSSAAGSMLYDVTETGALISKELSVHTFYLWAPTLGYRRRLLQVAHDPVVYYPVFFEVDIDHIQPNLIHGESMFEECLRAAFREHKTIAIIQALIHQSSE